MKKQIIEILTNAFKPDVRVYKEAIYMVKLGYEVTILCWDREPEDLLPKEELMDGIKVVRFRIVSAAGNDNTLHKFIAYYRFYKKCTDYLKTNQCDYLQCNDNSGAIIGVFAKNKRLPMVVDMHEFFEYGNFLKRWSLRKINILCFKNSVAGIYENPAYLDEHYKAVRDKLIPLRNYPSSDMIKYMPKIQCEIFRIGFHGWIRSRMIEFEALFKAVREMNDVRIDINGEGPGFQKISELAKEYDNIHINGRFDGTKELTALYEKTDVVFCGYDPDDPNYQGEAEVVKFYEAIVTGTPMLITEGIGMGEKVKNNGWGLSCDTRDSEQIRKAIIKLKDDRQFWIECSENELKAAPDYSWEQAVRCLEDIYPPLVVNV